VHHSQGRPRPATSCRCRGRVLRLATLAGALLAAACGSPAAPATSASPEPAAAYPVTVTSCGVPVTYNGAPTRAVSNDINTT
jgi:ABC-type Fe3+-hydroxamate transport system substrate-binding protein